MRKMLLWAMALTLAVCGLAGTGTVQAKEPARNPMVAEKNADSEGYRGRRSYRRQRSHRPRSVRPQPRRYYRYYAPPPVTYGRPCYYTNGVYVCY